MSAFDPKRTSGEWRTAGGTGIQNKRCYSRLSGVTTEQHRPEISGMTHAWARDELQAVLMGTTLALGGLSFRSKGGEMLKVLIVGLFTLVLVGGAAAQTSCPNRGTPFCRRVQARERSSGPGARADDQEVGER
jgi:hypothetical protein